MDYTIRHMEQGDMVSVKEIFADRKLLLGTMRLPYPSQAAVDERLSSTEGMVRLVADSDEGIGGIIEMQTYPSLPRHNHAGAIHLIATHPNHRGRGVGRALMAAIVDMADNWLNLRRLELSVWTPNATAISLYEEFGFAVEGTLSDYVFRDGEYVDALLMARMNR